MVSFPTSFQEKVDSFRVYLRNFQPCDHSFTALCNLILFITHSDQQKKLRIMLLFTISILLYNNQLKEPKIPPSEITQINFNCIVVSLMKIRRKNILLKPLACNDRCYQNSIGHSLKGFFITLVNGPNAHIDLYGYMRS